MHQRRHFHTFDALRFIAFFLVFLTHVPMQNPWLQPFKHSGGIGVSFFFVLSGFLISYIILHEKAGRGRLNLRNFFVRRILRIWPLYYAMIIFAFATPYLLQLLQLSYSNEGYEPVWWMSCLFLENYNMMFTGELPNVSPLPVMWSLCIEEHFYLLWGLTFYLVPLRKIPWVIGITILITYLSRLLYYHWGLSFSDIFTNLDYFAYGTIPAYFLIFKKDKIERLGQLPFWVKYAVVLLTISYIFISPNIVFLIQPFLDPLLFGCLFTTVLMFTLPIVSPLKISDNRLVSRLGIYTYGLYLYHTIVINLLKQVYYRLDWEMEDLLGGWCFFILALSLTIGVSVLSYWLFEKPFLRLKRYFYSN